MISGTGSRHATLAKPRPESRARSYARLAKLDVYDYYLSIFVVLAALAPAFDLGSLPMLAVYLVGEVLVIVAMVALDDLTGYRDGSDIANYGPDVPTRKKLRKPLVAGTLSARQALRFGWITALAGASCWALALALAPQRPLWTVGLIVGTYLVSLQYSYGIKLSYRGFQEVFLAALGWAVVVIPYGLVTGELPGFILVQGLLFGLGPLMFGVYSNTNDVAGDRAVNRPTVAALTSPAGNMVFIGTLSAGEFLLGAVASLTGIAPWWFVLLMLPATALRSRQYFLGFARADIMRARKLGFLVHRVTVALLIVANLLQGLTS